MCFVYRALEIQHFCFWFISIFSTFIKTGFSDEFVFIRQNYRRGYQAIVKSCNYLIKYFLCSINCKMYSRKLLSDVIFYSFQLFSPLNRRQQNISNNQLCLSFPASTADLTDKTFNWTQFILTTMLNYFLFSLLKRLKYNAILYCT